jgi:hypothetical protein
MKEGFFISFEERACYNRPEKLKQHGQAALKGFS